MKPRRRLGSHYECESGQLISSPQALLSCKHGMVDRPQSNVVTTGSHKFELTEVNSHGIFIKEYHLLWVLA